MHNELQEGQKPERPFLTVGEVTSESFLVENANNSATLFMY